MMRNLLSYSRRQYCIVILGIISLFLSGVIYSLQAPFYPAEAEKKGVRPYQYGFVFGIFELVSFIASIVIGSSVGLFGAKSMLLLGLFLAGSSTVIFGFLSWISDGYIFLLFSFICRIVEAVGQTGINLAVMAVVPVVFPESHGTVLSVVEAFYGIGLMFGPAIGGILYDKGGFLLPFLVVGVILLLNMAPGSLYIPSDKQLCSEDAKRHGLLRILRIPSVWMGILTLFSGVCCTGYLQATLEPHVRSLHLSGTVLGVMFLAQGFGYAISSPFWGYFSEKLVSPLVCMLCGCVFISIGFCFVGPLPFFGWERGMIDVMASVLVVGIGIGGEYMPSLLYMKQICISSGMEDNLSTQGLVSGVWLSSLTLGGFFGPSIGGIMFDKIGFRNGTLIILVLNFVLFVALLTCMKVCKRKSQKKTVKAFCFDSSGYESVK